MALVPAGEFQAGIEPGRLALYPASPGDKYCTARVAQTAAFYVDRYEVTKAMYREFLSATGYSPKGRDSWSFLFDWEEGQLSPGTENQPVRWVNRADCEAYAQWAGKRLPTSEEWEKAARGTDGRPYPWGWEEKPFALVHNQFPEGREYLPAHVDHLGASPYGCLHMTDSVQEWTSSEIVEEGEWRRVSGFVRWRPGVTFSLTLKDVDDRGSSIGFRCVRDVSPDKPEEGR
ncbi:MAG: SUMF1/EgtB/PvdO family nonheme iron enzyme [Planctomycetes bacterium]|nr:SUMF1/EgtB/PvdO family nonheme iron enzyme [Planctomycetota bacterium]